MPSYFKPNWFIPNYFIPNWFKSNWFKSNYFIANYFMANYFMLSDCQRIIWYFVVVTIASTKNAINGSKVTGVSVAVGAAG